MKIGDIIIIHSSNLTKSVVVSEKCPSTKLQQFKELNLENGIKIHENLNTSSKDSVSKSIPKYNNWYIERDGVLQAANHYIENDEHHLIF